MKGRLPSNPGISEETFSSRMVYGAWANSGLSRLKLRFISMHLVVRDVECGQQVKVYVSVRSSSSFR